LIKYSFTREETPTENSGGKSDLYSEIIVVIFRLLGELLNVNQSEIASIDNNIDRPFMSFGLDSLLIMDFRAQLNRHFNLNMSPTVLFDYPNPRLLSNHIYSLLSTLDQLPSIIDNKSCQQMLGPAVDEYAICGISCRFPGIGGENPDHFFENLCQGTDCISAVPNNWDSKVKYAGFLETHIAESFDPGFFGLTTAEANAMDPHQKILLEVNFEALVNGNLIDLASQKIVPSKSNIGVFVGLSNNEWIRGTGYPSYNVTPYTGTGVSQAAAANRISYCFGLTGPSVVIDTACSSSLVAVHMACNAIKVGDCETAIVSGADLLLSPFSLQVDIEI
jgi:hypothetical protein